VLDHARPLNVRTYVRRRRLKRSAWVGIGGLSLWCFSLEWGVRVEAFCLWIYGDLWIRVRTSSTCLRVTRRRHPAAHEADDPGQRGCAIRSHGRAALPPGEGTRGVRNEPEVGARSGPTGTRRRGRPPCWCIEVPHCTGRRVGPGYPIQRPRGSSLLPLLESSRMMGGNVIVRHQGDGCSAIRWR
jgi:hypothetical protein